VKLTDCKPGMLVWWYCGERDLQQVARIGHRSRWHPEFSTETELQGRMKMDTRSGDTFEASKDQMRDLLAGKEPMSGATAAKVGFRELTPQESSVVRECRLKGADLEKLLAEAKSMGADPRWTAIATTHFQEGLMALVRAVTRPAFF